MKLKLALLAIVLGVAATASATVTLNTQFGYAYGASGALVPDNALWILVVDTNGDNSFGGAFGLNSSLSESGANSLFTSGQSISVGGLLGNDTIFAMGGFSGTAGLGLGTTADTLILTLGQNGLTAGANYAFFWFTDSQYSGGSTGTVGSEVGGIHGSADSAAGLEPMVVPPDSSSINTGTATAADWDGSKSQAQFTAVRLIPEPSTMLLGAFGALGLLRRRR
jgi:hypothetical protein